MPGVSSPLPFLSFLFLPRACADHPEPPNRGASRGKRTHMVVKDPIHVYKGHTEAKGTTQVKGL